MKVNINKTKHFHDPYLVSLLFFHPLFFDSFSNVKNTKFGIHTVIQTFNFFRINGVVTVAVIF
jgi:hypothetical protein